MQHYTVTRRIVRKPGSDGYIRFEDVSIPIVAVNGATACKLADDVKASEDWPGIAPLNPKVAW